jgi:hypothetical protein
MQRLLCIELIDPSLVQHGFVNMYYKTMFKFITFVDSVEIFVCAIMSIISYK